MVCLHLGANCPRQPFTNGQSFPLSSSNRGVSLLWREPSRPGESHPEPLTDPDLTLSRHPARAIERRLPPSAENWGSSCCQLARSDVDDLLPLLHGHYPVSSLLW